MKKLRRPLARKSILLWSLPSVPTSEYEHATRPTRSTYPHKKESVHMHTSNLETHAHTSQLVLGAAFARKQVRSNEPTWSPHSENPGEEKSILFCLYVSIVKLFLLMWASFLFFCSNFICLLLPPNLSAYFTVKFRLDSSSFRKIPTEKFRMKKSVCKFSYNFGRKVSLNLRTKDFRKILDGKVCP
jgi:hypothetical protein